LPEIIALTESISPRSLGQIPRMVSKGDERVIIISNDYVNRNL
jgi:hypothetical protein